MIVSIGSDWIGSDRINFLPAAEPPPSLVGVRPRRVDRVSRSSRGRVGEQAGVVEDLLDDLFEHLLHPDLRLRAV